MATFRVISESNVRLSKNAVFLGFQKTRWGVFWRGFGTSVLYCHGVSLSGGCGFVRSFLAQELRFGTGQVAQKASKSSFSMGFRSYVRQFFGAFFAPSPSFRALLFGCGGGAVSELGKLEDGYFSCNFRKQR